MPADNSLSEKIFPLRINNGTESVVFRNSEELRPWGGTTHNGINYTLYSLTTDSKNFWNHNATLNEFDITIHFGNFEHEIEKLDGFIYLYWMQGRGLKTKLAVTHLNGIPVKPQNL